MFGRAGATAWFLAAVLIGSTVGAVSAGFRTDTGRSVLTRYGVSILNSVVHGTAEVGEVSGNLTDGLRARDVVIRGEDGTMLAHLPDVTLQYRIRDFLSANVAVGRVVLRDPLVHIVKGPNGRFNYQDVLGLGGGGDGDAVSSGPASRSPLVAFRRAEIRGATVVVRTPATGTDDSTVVTEEGPDGLVRVRRIDDLNAVVGYARLSSPFEGENSIRFDITELSALFSDPALDIRSMRGTLEIDGDSMAVNLSRFVLPGSETTVRGAMKWPGGPLQLNLALDARRWAVDDARPFVDALPWGLTGRGALTLRSLDPERMEVRADPVALTGVDGDGAVAGRFGMLIEPDGWTMLDTDLRFDTLGIDYLRPLVDSIPFAGRLSGQLAADGPSDALTIDAQIAFRDTMVADDPETYLDGRGLMSLDEAEVDGGFGFTAFVLDSAEVALGTVQRLLPFVELDGRLGLAGTLNGPWRNALFRGTLLQTQDGNAVSVARGTVRVDSRGETAGVWADLELDSIDFATLEPSYPRLPTQGRFAGVGFLAGHTDSLRFRFGLAGEAGRVDATGEAVLLPGTVGVRGLNVDTRALDLRRVEPGFPSSDLFAAVSGSVLRGDAGVDGDLEVRVDSSFVGGSALDAVVARFGFEGDVVIIDSLHILAPRLEALGSGRLGLGDSATGTVEARLRIDSLGTIGPLVRERFPGWADDSLLTELGGRADVDLRLEGSLDQFAVAVQATSPRAASSRTVAEGVSINVDWSNERDGVLGIQAAVDSLVLGRFVYSDLGLLAAGRRDSAAWEARARLGRDGSWYARGQIAERDSGFVVPLEFMGILLPENRWFLDGPASLSLSETGIGIGDLRLMSEDGGARFELDGRIPRGANPGEVRGNIESVPLSDLWALVQWDPEAVGGRLGGRMGLTGTATAPNWDFALQVTDGRLGAVRAPQVDATASYENGRLTGDGGVWRFGERILSLAFSLPVDLSLEGAQQRQLPGPITIDATADSMDLAFMSLVTPVVRNATGRLSSDVGIRGTWNRPRLTGNVVITGAGGTFPGIGVTHEGLEARLTLSGDSILVDSLSLRSGSGVARVDGVVRLEGLTRPIMDLQIASEDFRLIDVPDFLAMTMSGRVALNGPFFGAVLTGEGTVTDGQLYFADLVEKQIINLEDTLYTSLIDIDLLRTQGLGAAFENRLLDSLRIANLNLQMGSNVRLLSSEADIQLAGGLRLQKEADRYRFDGTLTTPRGQYRLPFGRGVSVGELIIREFSVTGGTVQYFGTTDLNADLDVDAQYPVRTTQGRNITVFVNIGGTMYAPEITLSSDVVPALPEDEIISYLLFNAPSGEALAGLDAQFVLSQLYGVVFSGLEQSLISDIGVPVDYLRIRPPSQGFSGAEIAVGWQLTPRTFVTLSPRICNQDQGLIQTGASLEYRFSETWHLSASRDPVNSCVLTGGTGRALKSQFGFDVFWEKRY